MQLSRLGSGTTRRIAATIAALSLTGPLLAVGIAPALAHNDDVDRSEASTGASGSVFEVACADGQAEILGYAEDHSPAGTTLVIPPTVPDPSGSDECVVTSIAADAFTDHDLTHVSIPDSVEDVSGNAFNDQTRTDADLDGQAPTPAGPGGSVRPTDTEDSDTDDSDAGNGAETSGNDTITGNADEGNTQALGTAVAATVGTIVTTWDGLRDAVADVCADDNGAVTLGADITVTGQGNLALTVGCDLTLDLNGHTLEITNPGVNAAIHVPAGAELTITDSSEGAGTLTATGGPFGAGIGGGNRGAGGTVTINGGVVTAEGDWAAGIGGGNEGAGGTVTINDGDVTAKGGYSGAGIGGGNRGDGGIVTINGGDVTAEGGQYAAGIGGGGRGGDGGIVTINGGDVTAEGGESGGGSLGGGAGIGGGHGASDTGTGAGGTVTISGGVVRAEGGAGGAGIGGGGSEFAAGGAGGDVTISGGDVTARGGAEGGAGIGGGGAPTSHGGGAGGTVTISGGGVEARGGEAAAGIGAGAGSDDRGSLTIEANRLEGSAGHGGGHEDRRATITWAEGSDGDLYALTVAEEDTRVFEVQFGYVLTVVPNNGDAPQTGVFTAFGTVPETPQAPPASAFDGWYADEDLTQRWDADQPGSPGTIWAGWHRLDEDGVVRVEDWDDLVRAVPFACNRSTIRLGDGPLDAPSGENLGLGVIEDCDLTLDLNGYALAITDPGSNNAAVHVPSGAALTVVDSSRGGGSLTATGSGFYAAGIGSSSGGDAGAVTITDGEVTATGSAYGAGIGGAGAHDGPGGDGGSVTITGGVVNATGGTRAAGIGGGGAFGDPGERHGDDGGEVTITGGSVRATGGGEFNVHAGTGGAGIGAGQDGQNPGDLVIEALDAVNTGQHGGGPEHLRADIDWADSDSGDLYALAQVSEDDAAFALDFGHVLEVTGFHHEAEDQYAPETEQRFVPLGQTYQDGLPEENVPEGFTFTGWRDSAPAGDEIAEEDLAGLLGAGSVFLYATAARAGLDPESVTPGGTAEVSLEAFTTDGQRADVTGDAAITFADGEVEGPVLTAPTAAGPYPVEVDYLGKTFDLTVTVEAGAAHSLAVDGPRAVTETETAAYTVEVVDEHGNFREPVVLGAGDVSSNVEADEITVDEGSGEIVVEFAFTPDALVDTRTLTFTHPDDETVVETVSVTVSSAVESIELAEVSAAHGETVTVSVTALNGDGAVLGQVAGHATITSDHKTDVVNGVEARFLGAGERVLTATYRGLEATSTVQVAPAGTEVTAHPVQNTITAGEDVVIDVMVVSPVSDDLVVTGEVEVWRAGDDPDQEEPLAGAALEDGQARVSLPGLTGAGDHDLVVRYTGASDFAPGSSESLTVTVLPADAAVLVIDGPEAVTETETGTYTAEAFDAYGNRRGDVTSQVVIASTIEADEITGNQIEFAFTAELTDRVLTFTYTDDADQTVTETMDVAVTSGVAALALEIPADAIEGGTVEVGVIALTGDDTPLGEVTGHTVLTSSVHEDVIEGNRIAVTQPGPREITAAYRDLEETISLEVTAEEPPARIDVDFARTEVRPGEEQQATITGYAPGTAVTGTMYSTPLDLGTQNVDHTGTVVFTWTIPTDIEPGTHTLELAAEGYETVTAEFTVLPAAPASGGADRMADTGMNATTGIFAALAAVALLAGVLVLIATRRTTR